MSLIDAMAGPPEDAGAHPETRLAKVLGYVPRVLASKPHIIFLAVLGVYLVVLPLLHVHVSAFAELVGGNYTNVTSDLGACIAAGGTLHIIRSHREHRKEIAHLHELVAEMHAKLEGRS
jgi:predicted phage tail protein